MSIINTASLEKIQYFAEQMLGQSFRSPQDAWRAWLQTETSSTGSLYDLEMRWLGSQGRTGSLYDRWRQECIAAGYTELFPEAINAYLDNPATGIGGIDEYTKLMLHMDGADASTTFTDSELTPKTVTANGNAQIDTAQSKFGGASGLFDGTGDYLSIPDSTDFDFGTGDFTIDFWIRPATNPAASGYGGLISTDNAAGGSNGWEVWISNTRIVTFSMSGAGTALLESAALTANVWTHIAVVRNGTGASGLTLYINGTAVDTYTGNVTINDGNLGMVLGRIYTTFFAGHTYNGYMDEVRLSKGIARWTTDFTPPAEAYSQ